MTSKTKLTSADYAAQYIGLFERMLRRIPVPEWGHRINARDNFLRQFAYSEPVLAGVVNSTIQRDQARSWSLTGTSRQVQFFANVLKNADDDSWMNFVGRLAEAFYTTDYGAVVEVGRDEPNPSRRVTGFWSVDPVRVEKHRDGTLTYDPINFETDVKLEDFEWFDFYALPSSNAKTFGLGRCAVGRVIQAVKIMQGIFEYDSAELNAEQADSILTVKGMNFQQFSQRIEERKTQIENGELPSNSPLVLASLEDIQIGLQSLSRIPFDFDRQAFADLLLQILAVNFGFNVSEFFSIRSNAFVTGQTDTQTLRSTSKGDKAFSLALAERLTQNLPDTISFEFETQSDFAKDLQSAALLDQARSIKLLTDAGVKSGEAILTREEARAILKELGVLPDSVDIINEQVVVSRESLMADDKIRRLAYRMDERGRSEPLVRYQWDAFGSDKYITVRNDVRELLERRSFPVLKRATLIKTTHKNTTVDEEDVNEALGFLPEDLKELLTDAI